MDYGIVFHLFSSFSSGFGFSPIFLFPILIPTAIYHVLIQWQKALSFMFMFPSSSSSSSSSSDIPPMPGRRVVSWFRLRWLAVPFPRRFFPSLPFSSVRHRSASSFMIIITPHQRRLCPDLLTVSHDAQAECWTWSL